MTRIRCFEVEARASVDGYRKQERELGDESGNMAVAMGAECYNRAMELAGADDREGRIAFFQAAEYLYRMAREKGNVWGYVDGGYIYYYDRCEGRYYPDFTEDTQSEEARAYCEAFDADAAAYECYAYAADAGEPQSCYKLGDMLKNGRGCKADAASAVAMYERAYELGKKDDTICWGGAALRLGDCYEKGIGVRQDFAWARMWYECAVVGLGAAVEAGDWFYEKSLAGAKAGAARCRQEIEGSY